MIKSINHENIKPAEKDCLATSITGKLWLATNQKQKHDLQL